MDIKQFQKGQSAYMLKENHGYSKPPDSHEQNSKYFVQEFPHTGRKGFSNHAMICSFIVMKCEGFSMVSDLVDYLYNNLLMSDSLPATASPSIRSFTAAFISSMVPSAITPLLFARPPMMAVSPKSCLLSGIGALFSLKCVL